MRLFVAIAPPHGVLDEVEAAVAPLRPAWPALRWTGRPAWHVTLAFLGEVGEQAAEAIFVRAAGGRATRDQRPWAGARRGAGRHNEA